MAVRTFVALELSRPLKEGILDLAQRMEARGVRASWARASTLHLTLKFLGDVEEENLPDVFEAVARAAARVAPFSFESRSLGAFPSPRRAGVLWVGVEAPQELWDLARGVEDELAGLGFPREKRRFRPHITLGRVRNPRDDAPVEELLRTLEAPAETVEAREVFTMRSELRPGGAVHEVIAMARLAGGRAPGVHAGDQTP
jgi:2'-5' RNA ligase